MKFATFVAAALAAFATVEASIVPVEHHGRFLQEREQLTAELKAWKNSKAGQEARTKGFYVEKNVLLGATNTKESDDHLARFFMTKLNIEDAQKQNPEAQFGVNTPFTLMTNDEFVAYVHRSAAGFKALPALNATAAEPVRNLREAATSKDWSTGSCVAPIKDQGQCGSCWSFSAVSVVESAYCLKHGSLTRLSEQQLVSCDTANYGCDGGFEDKGISYIKKNGGISTEASYPYTSGKTEVNGQCTTTGHTKFPLTITSLKYVGASDAAFVTALDLRPISVSVAAGNPSWKQYTGGVVSSCSTTQLDHAVVAVGYDATSFKIRNSWGTSWGNKGYINLKRLSSSKAACGVINTDAVYPVVA